MPSEIDILIDESMLLRSEMQKHQDRYDANRRRILEIMTETNRKHYVYKSCKALRTEEISIESVSKEFFIKALKEVDIPRDKKVFIWNASIKEVKRPATIILQTIRATNQPIPENQGGN